MPYYDILLEPSQLIYLSLYGCIRQNSCCLLEGSRGKEGIDLERCTRYAEQNGARHCGLSAFFHDSSIFVMEFMLIHLLAINEYRISWIDYFDLLHHLTDDDSYMFIIDSYTLSTVDLLYLIHEVALAFLFTQNRKDIMWILDSIA